MQLIDFQTMKNGKYHEKQIVYNMQASLAELKKQHPNITPQGLQAHAAEINKSAWAPMIQGELAKSLGLKGKVLTDTMWQDLSAGYSPAEYLPKKSPLQKYVVDTPRGKLVKLNNNALPIAADGTYEQPKDEKKGRAIGTEFVFGFGQNFSLTLARMMSEDNTVEQRFKAICDRNLSKVLDGMLEDAQIRLGKDGVDRQYAKEVMMVSFLHIENRSESPYIHLHADLLNAARGYNDTLTSLYSGFIAKNKFKFSAEFMGLMKGDLESEFGMVFSEVFLREDELNPFLSDEERNITSYDLPDSAVPSAVREVFNKRDEEMEQAMKDSGRSGFIAREIARLESRDDKTEKSPSELKAQWKAEFDKHGWTVEHVHEQLDFKQIKLNNTTISDELIAAKFVRKQHEQEVARSGPVQVSKDPTQAYIDAMSDRILKSQAAAVEQARGVDDEELIKGFYRKHKEVCFTEDQFKAHITIQLLKTHNHFEAKRESARIFEKECVHMIDKEKIDYYKDFMLDQIADPVEYRRKQMSFARDLQFTTRGVLEQERYISESLKARDNETSFVIPEDEARLHCIQFEQRASEAMKKPVTFSTGQRNAVMKALTDTGATCMICGDPGVGKTFAQKAIKEAYEDKGFRVWGTAPTSKATEGLAEDAQIKKGQGFNVAELLIKLDSKKVKWSSKDVILGDEMGMVCLDDFHRLVKHANEAGAKLILTGDHKQLQSVAHGGSFRILSDQFHAEAITEINRQRDSWQRQMVQEFGNGHADRGMRTLYDAGRVEITKTEQERRAAIVRDYMDDPQHFKSKFIIAATNQDVDNLNDLVRDKLKERGYLQGDEATVRCADGKERRFAMGDRVIFTRNNKSDDIRTQHLKNSEVGTVTNLRHDRLTGKVIAIQIEMDTGKTVWKKTRDTELPIKHGYVSTVHKSQGATKENTYWFPSSDMNSLHSAYVAVSRHKGNLKIYLSDEQADMIVDKMEDKEPTARMLSVAKWIAEKTNTQLTDEQTQSFREVRNFLNAHYQDYDKEGQEAPHRMDDFMSIVQAMCKSDFKKSTYDFEILKEDSRIVDTYRKTRIERAEQVNAQREPEQEVVLRTRAQEQAHQDLMKQLVASSELYKRKQQAVSVDRI